MAAHRRMAAHARRPGLRSRRAVPGRRRRRARAGGRLRRMLPCPGAASPSPPAFCCSRSPSTSTSAASICSSSQHTIFDGVTYTDAHVTLIGMLFISAALALGAVIAFAGGILRPRRALAACSHRSRRCLLRCGRHRRLVCEHFHRQAQPARPRAALHRRQHRLDAPGLRARPLCAARVSRRHHRRRGRSGTQSGHARQHSPVGRGRAAGHAAPGAGDSHLLRLSRHRHRSLPDQRLAAPGDARRARAECGQAARQQPQLDQRQAHLHARLRHHHESRERIHAGGPADALL